MQPSGLKGKQGAKFADCLRNTVLVVDDDKVNRTILVALVRRLGFNCQQYETGSGVLAAFQESSRSGARVAAIIMDINMPGMDGLEAVWRIRRIEAQKREACCCQDAVVPTSVLPARQARHPKRDGNSNDSSVDSLCEACQASHTPVWAVSACGLQEQLKSPAMKLVSTSKSGPPWQLAGFDAFIPKSVHSTQLVQLVSMLNSRKENGYVQRSLDLRQSSTSTNSSDGATTTFKLDSSVKTHGQGVNLDAGTGNLTRVINDCQPDSSTVPEICSQAS